MYHSQTGSPIFEPEIPFSNRKYYFRTGSTILEPEVLFSNRKYHSQTGSTIFEPEVPLSNRKYYFRTGCTILKPEVSFSNRKYYFRTGSNYLKPEVLFLNRKYWMLILLRLSNNKFSSVKQNLTSLFLKTILKPEVKNFQDLASAVDHAFFIYLNKIWSKNYILYSREVKIENGEKLFPLFLFLEFVIFAEKFFSRLVWPVWGVNTVGREIQVQIQTSIWI